MRFSFQRLFVAVLLPLSGCGVADTFDLLCPVGTVSTSAGCQRTQNDAGGAPQPALLSPPTLDFGFVPRGRSRTKTFKLTNPNPDRMSVRVKGFDSGSIFAVDLPRAPTLIELQPFEEWNVEVLADNRSAQSEFGGSIDFDLCRAGCPATLQLSATGVGTIDCETIEFPETEVGSCAIARGECENPFGEPLAFQGLIEFDPVDGAFFSNVPPPVSVAPGGVFSQEVVFCPRRAGEFEATALLGASFQDGTEVQFRTEVVGTAPGRTTCAFEYPVEVEFPETAVGELNFAVIDLLNVGPPCAVSDIRIIRDTGGFFLASSENEPTIQPGRVRSITVGFQPGGVGMFTGTLQGQTSDGFTNIEVQLFASGINNNPLGRYETVILPAPPSPMLQLTPLSFPGTDDEIARVTLLPFPIEFLDMPVGTLYVSTNGFVGFELVSFSAFANDVIPFANEPNAFIAWWWDDLVLGSSSVVSTAISGNIPSRTFHIVFENMEYLAGPGMSLLSGEYRFHENDSTIEVIYRDLPAGNQGTATVGWENRTGTMGGDALGCSNVCSNAQYPAQQMIRYVYVPN